MISVIIPIYNVERYLEKCLDSVLAQSFKEFEVLAVDDGSTDRSGILIDAYAKRDCRVKPIHKANGGLGSAYNAGLARAQGRYVAMVEADDWVAGNFLECLVKKAEETQADITKCNFFLAYSDTSWRDCRKFAGIPPGAATYTFSQLRSLPFGHLGFWAGLYRRDFLTRHGIRFLELPGPGYVDCHFFWTSHARAQSIALLDRPLYYYRQDNPGASVKCTDRRLFLVVENYRQVKKDLEAAGMYGEFKTLLLQVQYQVYLRLFELLQPQFKEEFAAMVGKDLSEIDEVVLIEGGFSKEDRRNVDLLLQGRFYRDWARRMALADSLPVRCGQLGITLLRTPSSLVSEEFWSMTPLRQKLYGWFYDPSIGRDLSRLRQTATTRALASVGRYLLRDALPASLIACRLGLKVCVYPLRTLVRGIRSLRTPSQD